MPSNAGDGAPTLSSLKVTMFADVSAGLGVFAGSTAPEMAALGVGAAAAGAGTLAFTAADVEPVCGAAVDAGRSQAPKETARQSRTRLSIERT